ncbi:MAG: tetratricopeptide repeat protein, partial [Gemmatimonadetes bacterium]|nr:tetratricopeptide repeat protein [Gemmatimonadota bacterium]NIR78388.1 tetratricopeptide repeat protein [Gemmatimonadota bacterium]NIT86992.1 tetratricopeptide repeat protein [Gemmatimonadota bacterium]NIU30836.1 tetratricopeptide repeat protein [Gemmatimonadota bacterium]NIV61204.1 tetratricopeptide repeat protein [Gemmatimonadota bacterium]
AILGGVVALSLLFGAAGLYVALTGGRGILGPAQASAGGTPTAVAVLPFQTRGEEMTLYGEGMVDLLTTNLEGLGGLRTINAGSVVARWRTQVGETFTAELDEALRVAAGLDARYAIRGSAVAAGDRVRLVAEIFDLADRSRVGSVQVEGPGDGMLELVDALTVELARTFLGAREDAAARTAGVSTNSIEALEAYLRGEALYREARFGDAIEALDEALAADSSFALAYWRLSEAWGWVDPLSDESREASRKAVALASELPARQRLLVRADAALVESRNTYIEELRDYLRLHPEDPDAWNTLGEAEMHWPWMVMSPGAEYVEAFRRAVELVPTFGPYYTHLLGWALAEGEEARFRELVDAYASQGADSAFVEVIERTWDFVRGSPEQMRSAEAFFDRSDDPRLNFVSLILFQGDELAPRALAAAPYLQGGASGLPQTLNLLRMNTGRPPAEWDRESRDWAYARMAWGLLAEPEPGPVPGTLVDVLDGNPTVEEGVAASVLAARAGTDTVRTRALAALDAMDLEARDVPLGIFGGAATADEARRSAAAAAHLVAGRPDEAHALLEETLAQDAFDPLAVLLMGDTEAALGNPAEAIRYWETLLRTPFRPHVRLRTGRAYEELGRTEEALEAYRGLLTMWADADPSLPPVVEAREAVERLGG